jgi:hypothetical protein
MDCMEVDGFLCDFCQKLRDQDELHSKRKDGRLKCDECYTHGQDVLSELVQINQDMGMYE